MNFAFVMVPAFLAIIVPQIRSISSAICGVVAAGGSLLFVDLPHQIGLMLAAIVAIFITLVVERFIHQSNSG